MEEKMRMEHVGAWILGVAFALGLLLMFSLLTGCATTNKAFVATEGIVHDKVAKLDDNVRTFCTAHPELAAPCADTKKPMLALVDAAIAVNRGVKSQQLAGWTDLLTAAGNLGKALAKLPEGATKQWFEDLKAVVVAAGQGV